MQPNRHPSSAVTSQYHDLSLKIDLKCFISRIDLAYKIYELTMTDGLPRRFHMSKICPSKKTPQEFFPFSKLKWQ